MSYTRERQARTIAEHLDQPVAFATRARTQFGAVHLEQHVAHRHHQAAFGFHRIEIGQFDLQLAQLSPRVIRVGPGERCVVARDLGLAPALLGVEAILSCLAARLIRIPVRPVRFARARVDQHRLTLAVEVRTDVCRVTRKAFGFRDQHHAPRDVKPVIELVGVHAAAVGDGVDRRFGVAQLGRGVWGDALVVAHVAQLALQP